MTSEAIKRSKVVAGAGSSGGGGGSEASDTLKSKSYLSIIDLIGEGQIGGLVDNSPKSIFLNDTPIVSKSGQNNFDNVEWRFVDGRQNQQSLGDGFNSIESTTTLNREVRSLTPVSFAVNDPNAELVRLTLAVPVLTSTDDKGNINGSKVEFAVEVAVNGERYQEIGTDVISGKTRSRYQRSYSYRLPRVDQYGNAAKSWTFQVSRITPEPEDSSTNNALFVDNYTTVIETTLTYPNTAVLGLKINAEEFPNEPQRSYLVDGLLIKVPSNRDSKTRTYSGVWTGAFKLEVCDNPAWILFDLLSNERYGLGQFVPAEFRNPARLYQIGRYCDELVDDGFGGKEPRFTINTAITSLADAYQLISDICSVFNGMAYWTGNMVGFMADMPSEPVMIYSQANVIDGDFTYQSSSRKDRHSVALISYNDPQYNYETRTEYVEDSDLIERFGVRKVEIAAFGCTTRGQASRVGQWLLYTEKYQSSTVNFRVGVDSLFIVPGDIVQISDVYRAGKRQGGRLVESTLEYVVLDGDLDIVADSLIAIRVADGTLQERKIVGVNGRKVFLDKPLTMLPEKNAVWQVTAPNLKPVTARVISVAQSDNAGEYEITAVMHNDSKYDFIEKGFKLENIDVTTIDPTTTVEKPSFVKITPERTIEQGVTKYSMNISWGQSRGASGYIVQYRKEDGNWVLLPTQTGLSVDVEDVFTGYYQASVQALAPLGGKSQVTYSELTAVDGTASILPKIPLVEVESLAWGIGLSWAFPVEASGVKYTEIQQSFDYEDLSPDGAEWHDLTVVPYPGSSYQLSGLTSLDHRHFRLRLVDSLDQKGEWSDPAYGYPTSDIESLKKILEGQVGSDWLDATLVGQIDQTNEDLKEAFDRIGTLGENIIAEAQAREEAIAVEVDRLNESIGKEAQDRANAISSAVAKEASDRANAIAAESQARADALAAEAKARTDALAAEAQARADALEQEVLDRNQAINNAIAQEKADRAEAIAEESAKQTQALQAETQARANAIAQEAQARAQALSQEAANRTNQISELANRLDTDIDTLTQEIADSTAAQTAALNSKTAQLTQDYTKRINELQTKTNTDVAALNDGLTSAVDEFRTADGALTSSLNAHKVSMANSIAAVQESVRVAVNDQQATSERLDGHITTFETFEAKTKADITALEKTVTDGQSATAEQINALSTEFESQLAQTNSSVQDVAQSVSDLDSATATKFSNVEAAISATNADIQQTNKAVANALSVANSAVTENQAQAERLDQLSARLDTTDGEVAKKADITVTDGIKADVTKNAQGIASAVADITKLTNNLATTNANVAKKADTTALNALQSEVTEIDGELTAQSGQITELGARLDTVDSKAGTAIASAAQAQLTADTAVSANEAMSQRIDQLQASLLEIDEETETFIDATAFNALKSQVTTNKDGITAANQNITKLQSDLTAQTGEVNGIKETVTGHTSAIGGLTTTQTQHGKDIKQAAADITSLKADMDAVEADVQTRATTTALNSTNAEVQRVDGRVTTVTSDLTALAGRVTTAEGNIAKKADAAALNNYYTKTEANNAIAGQISTFNASLVIGGVNQLLNSEAERTSVAATRREYLLYERSEHLKEFYDEYLGKDITISFDLKVPVAGNVQLYASNASHHSFATSVTVKEENVDKWFRYAVTVRPQNRPESASGYSPTHSTLEFFGTYDSGRIPTVRKVQLEAGSKATSWSPSPRDVQQALDANANAIEETNAVVKNVDGRLTTTANSLTALTGRVAANESGLKTKADASALNNYYTKTQADDKATEIAAGQISEFGASLSVGSENLITQALWKTPNFNTVNQKDGYEFKLVQATAPYNAWAQFGPWAHIELGTKMTFSFKIKALDDTPLTVGGHTGGIQSSGSPVVYLDGVLVKGSTWRSGTVTIPNDDKYHLVVVLLEKNSTAATDFIYIQPNRPTSYDRAVNCSVKEVMLSVGNVYVGWTEPKEFIQKQLDANAQAINSTNAEVSRVNGVVVAQGSSISTLQSNLTKTDATANTAVQNAATAQTTANTAVTQAQSVANAVSKLEAKYDSDRSGISLIPDHMMTNPDQWRSHYGTSLADFFVTTETGAVGNTVFRKPETVSSCWNYSRTALPNDRVYKLSMRVRRQPESTGTMYFTVNFIEIDGVHDNTYGHITMNDIPADGEWHHITRTWDNRARADAKQLAFGFALNHSLAGYWCEMQDFRVTAVINADDIGNDIATKASLDSVQTTLANADTALGKRIDTLTTTVNNNNTAVTGKIATVESSITTLEGSLNTKTTELASSIAKVNENIGKKADATALNDYYTKSESDNKATEIAAGEVNKFSANLSIGGQNLLDKSAYNFRVGNIIAANNSLLFREILADGSLKITCDPAYNSGYISTWHGVGTSFTKMMNELRNGEEFTVTLWVKAVDVENLPTANFTVYLASQLSYLALNGDVTRLSSGKEVPFSHVRKWNSAITTISPHLTVTKASIGGGIIITKWKIERGNQSTDWTPSIGEVESSIKANASAITTTNANVTNIDGKVTSQAQQITKLQSDLRTVDEKTGTLTEGLADAQEQLVTNSTATQQLANRTSALEASMSSVEDELDTKASAAALELTNAEVTRLDGVTKSTSSSVTSLSNTLNTVSSNANKALSAVEVKDTRSKDELPQWYWSNHPKRIVNEFKQASAIGVTGLGNYVNLETRVYYGDSSGGPIIQIAHSATDPLLQMVRHSSGVRDAAVWTEWKQPLKTLNDTINTKASSAAVSQLDSKVEEIEGQVTAQATEIRDLNAELETANELIGQNTAAAAQAKSTADAAVTANQATATELNTLKSTVTAVQGTLAKKADSSALNNYYTKAQADTKATEIAAGEVSKYNASLKVGGSNLQAGTAKFANFAKYSTPTMSKVDAAMRTEVVRVVKTLIGAQGASLGVKFRTVAVKKGEEYILTLMARGDVQPNYIYLMVGGVNGANSAMKVDAVTNYNAETFTQITARITGVDNRSTAYVMIANNGGAVGSWFEFAEVMFQQGNKATPWEPSPLDTDVAIANVMEVTADAIENVESRVQEVEGEVQANSTSISQLTSGLAATDAKAGTALNNAATAQSTANTAVTKAESAATATSKLEAKYESDKTGVSLIPDHMMTNPDHWQSHYGTSLTKNFVTTDTGKFGKTVFRKLETETQCWNYSRTLLPNDKPYKLSMWVRRQEGSSGSNYFTVGFIDANDTRTNYSYSSINIPADGEWHKVTVKWDLTKQADVTQLAFGFAINHSSSVAGHWAEVQDFRVTHIVTAEDSDESIASKADLESVQTTLANADAALGQRIDTLTTTVNANNTTVTGRVSNVEKSVTTLEGNFNTKVTELTSSIKTANDNIAKKADASALNNYYTKTEANNAISGQLTTFKSSLAVGGANQLVNSEGERYNKSSTNAEYLLYERSEHLKNFYEENLEKDVTISFDLKVAVAGVVQIYASNSSFHSFNTSVEVPAANVNKWVRYKVTVQPKRHSTNTTATMSSLEFFGTYNTGRIPYLRKVKMESGSIATDWSWSDRDFVDSILALGTLVTNTYTKAQTNSVVSTATTNLKTQFDKSIATINTSLTALSEADKAVATRVDGLEVELDGAKSSISTVEDSVADLETSMSTQITNLRSELKKDTDDDVAALSATIANTYITKTAAASAISSATTSLKSEVTAAIDDAVSEIKLDAVEITDTRSVDSTPEWYWENYARKRVTEFKSATTIGLTADQSGHNYVTLESLVRWSDSSGGPIQQIARGSTEDKTYVRYSSSTTTWTAWVVQGSTETSKLSTTITQQAQTINGVMGIRSVTIDNNGVISGYGLVSELVDGKVTSAFGVNADQFYVGSPSTGKKVFAIVNGQTVINDAIIGNLSAAKITAGTMHGDRITVGTLKGDRMVAKSIDATKLNVGDLSAISANLGSIQVGSANIADAAITTAKIGNLQVDTIKIKDQAITVGLGNSGQKSITITSTGGLIRVEFSFSVSGGPSYASGLTVWIKRGSTVVRSQSFGSSSSKSDDGMTDYWFSSSGCIMVAVEKLTAGTYTYTIGIDGNESTYLKNITATAMEFKK